MLSSKQFFIWLTFTLLALHSLQPVLLFRCGFRVAFFFPTLVPLPSAKTFDWCVSFMELNEIFCLNTISSTKDQIR